MPSDFVCKLSVGMRRSHMHRLMALPAGQIVQPSIDLPTIKFHPFLLAIHVRATIHKPSGRLTWPARGLLETWGISRRPRRTPGGLRTHECLEVVAATNAVGGQPHTRSGMGALSSQAVMPLPRPARRRYRGLQNGMPWGTYHRTPSKTYVRGGEGTALK